jgi:hypothetical protein
MAHEPSNGIHPSPEAELRDLEDELCRLAGVVAVRVVGDRVGRPIEVHVLADQTKPPKQTVRDVRALAQTVFGMEIDHRIVSVAQLDEGQSPDDAAPKAATGAPRVRVVTVSVEVQGVRAGVRVTLADGELEHTGFAEGSAASVARPHLVAAAALDALRQLDPRADAIHIDAAQVTRVAASRVAVVTVVYVEPPLELFVSGSAVVRQDRDEAVARALLDATNRRVGLAGTTGVH